MPNGLVLSTPPPQPYIYEPHYYFFYGTLANPSILKGVLNLPESSDPVLHPAKVYGYELTNWGQYKALVDGEPGAVVEGHGYFVESAEHEYKLAYYETNAYTLAPCNLYFIDGGPDGCTEDEKPTPGYTFKYAGNAQSLKEGRFDRALWEMQMGMQLPPGWKKEGESGR